MSTGPFSRTYVRRCWAGWVLVVADPMAKLRAVLAAAKTLATLSRINLSLVDTAIRAQAHEELEERVTQLEARLPSTQGRK